MKKRGLYILILALCLGSYGWLFFNVGVQSAAKTSLSICLFKNITSIPCPACGTTQSVLSILGGNVSEAIFYNPLGFLAVILLLVAPLWILYDFVFNRNTLLRIYNAMELQLKNKFIALPLVTIVLVNWIWNIMKAL